MSSAQRTCPRCSTPFAHAPENVELRCSRCGATVTFRSRPAGFAAAPPRPNPAPAPPPAATAAPPPVAAEPDWRDPLTERRRRMILVGSGAALVLVVGLMLLLVFLGKRSGGQPTSGASSTRSPEVAAVPPSTKPSEDALKKPPSTSAKPPAGPPTPPTPPAAVPPVADPPLPGLVADLPPDLQKKVDEAIERGVAYLKIARSWSRLGMLGSNQLSVDSLVGLTLLECGVPADETVIQQISESVRNQGPQLTYTYGLALAILFLDRLNNPQDVPLIRNMAARLIAGQNTGGGWTYNCPALSESDTGRLLTLLGQSSSPPTGTQSSSGRDDLTGASPQVGNRPEPNAGGFLRKPTFRPAAPVSLDNLPVLQYTHSNTPASHTFGRIGGGDNSNTQFAILGVWAARRHGVAVERSVAMIDDRFRASQNDDGSWGYHGKDKNRTDSMTCAGLLGLAVGRGSQSAGMAPAMDPAIDSGLRHLGQRIGVLVPRKAIEAGEGRGVRSRSQLVGANAWGDLYFLWSLERVGMIYGLKTIGGKEWYPWGVPVIVAHQNPDGSWAEAFPGPPDTCFALLFLKRVNVAKDLTKKLLLFGAIKDPGATGNKQDGPQE